MEGIIHDLRFGARTLWRNPGFTLIVVVTLALGIGANATMWSVTSSALFRQLPFPEADRIMSLWRDTERFDRTPFSIPTFRDWHERNRAFEYLAIFRETGVNLSSADGEPERVNGLMVSAEFAPALGLEPILGRGFLAEDDRPGAPRTVMLGQELWQRHYGGTPEVIGKTVRLDGEPYTIIGVLPGGIRTERIGDNSRIGDLWLPIGLFFDSLDSEDRASRGYEGVGRLKADTSIAVAREDMARITRELAEEHPDTYVGNLLTGETLLKDQVSGLKPALLILLAAVAFVLLITVSNLINLQLTRNSNRDHELATRTALGAGRGHLLRQLSAEGLLLALPGGLLGLLVGQFSVRTLPHFVSDSVFAEAASIDGPTIVITLFLTLVVGLLIGLIPALRATHPKRQKALAERGLLTRNFLPQQRLRQVLTIFQLALAVVLLIGAGLMLRTLQALQSEDPGFEPARLQTFNVVLPQTDFAQTYPWLAYFEAALDRLRALPEVERAAITSLRPMDNPTLSIAAAEDREMPKTKDMAFATYELVSPDYFRTLGIPLLEGRDFDQHDTDETNEAVVIVNESLARQFWPDESPLGKLFAYEFIGPAENPEPQWRRIVGVVGDVRNLELSEPPLPSAYSPYTQRSPYFESSPVMTLMVRTTGDTSQLVATLREELRAIAPHLPLADESTMIDIIDIQLNRPRMVSMLLSSFSVIALILAALGVYGVIARNVTTRTREIGTRMAFGATRRRLIGAFLGTGCKFVAVGVVIGWIAAIFLTRLLTGMLYGVTASDPWVYLAVGFLLTLIAIFATIQPILRATAIRPAEALRYE